MNGYVIRARRWYGGDLTTSHFSYFIGFRSITGTDWSISPPHAKVYATLVDAVTALATLPDFSPWTIELVKVP